MTHLAIAGDSLAYSPRSGRNLLEDVSISVADGERLAIIGPNGAGKTTLLRLLAGLQSPTSGTVRLYDRDIRAMRPVDRARLVAVVGQVDQPDHRICVRDYVGLGRVPHHGQVQKADDRAIVDAALVRTGIEAFAGREMGSLSGGERQRAQIARALAQEPRILFLDEPTNHLDPRARSDLMRFVAGLDLTVVAVLHDLHVVPEFATQVAVVDAGRIVACGPPDQALSRETVQRVFGIDLFRLPHPVENRHVTVFDIPSQL